MPSAAIGQASAYVPLDDIAYTYVNALMARGMFRELSSLERPYTERALRVAIDSARTRDPDPVIASYLDALYLAVEKYAVRPGNSDTTASETFRARGTGDVYATAQTSGRRELMLADSTSGVRPGGSIRLLMAGGPVVDSLGCSSTVVSTSIPNMPGERIERSTVGPRTAMSADTGNSGSFRSAGWLGTGGRRRWMGSCWGITHTPTIISSG
ncbi:MAG TPA: hypothetical protein VF908_03900 [Gemmatimonadaceae bacterium]